MEQIVFPVPSICEFLTKESKLRIYYTTERDEQGSKINDFFLRSEDLFNEMNWQKKLRGASRGPHACGAGCAPTPHPPSQTGREPSRGGRGQEVPDRRARAGEWAPAPAPAPRAPRSTSQEAPGV